MNIFLVEDEPPILRSIKNTILSFEEDYNIVGTACTGQAALDFIKLHHNEIDIMITDIQIPILTGLELTKYTARNHPHILVIILTGYSHFEYARTALQNGVFDYLLKPIDAEELRARLKRAYVQKCVDSLDRNSQHFVSDQKRKSDGYHYILSLYNFGPYPIRTSDLTSNEYANICPDLKEHFLHYFKENEFWIIPGSTPCEKNILFFFPDGEIDEIQKKLHEYFSPLLSAVPTATIIINSDFVGLSSIKTAAIELREYANRYTTLEKPQIIFTNEHEQAHSIEQEDLFQQYHNRLAELFEQKSLILFHSELKNYVIKIKKYLPSQQCLFDLLSKLFHVCIAQLSQDIGLHIDIYTTVLDVINCSESYQILYENLVSIFDSYFEAMLKDMHSPAHKEDIILQIDSYIKENYAKSINTTSIARHFNFTPAYLSKLFREYRSVTPSTYVIQIRIEKAKELFKNKNNCKIKEVAEYVGYEDPLYFSKVFKKMTGMSPRQFIQDSQ